MHGNGNDFVLVDNTDLGIDFTRERVERIARRRFGVGCDQLLVAEPATTAAADLRMRIFNTDGSTAGHCGNGLRSFAVFAQARGLVRGADVRVEIPEAVVTAHIVDENEVHTAMGRPSFEPGRIPLAVPAREPFYEAHVEQRCVRFSALSMGNPHAVVVVADVATAPVQALGPALQALPLFPEGVNVGFCERVSRTRARLRVFERGAGETLACGSGACAAVVAGIVSGDLDADVLVDLPGGSLQVHWDGEDSEVLLSGPATHVFDGELEL
jgi:diaminopimelate epimerase